MKAKPKHVLIVGASGAIGRAFVDHFARDSHCLVRAVSRSKCYFQQPNVIHHEVIFESEDQWQCLSEAIVASQPFDRIVVASGLLHNQKISPEKSLADLNLQKLQAVFFINTFLPNPMS